MAAIICRSRGIALKDSASSGTPNEVEKSFRQHNRRHAGAHFGNFRHFIVEPGWLHRPPS